MLFFFCLVVVVDFVIVFFSCLQVELTRDAKNLYFSVCVNLWWAYVFTVHCVFNVLLSDSWYDRKSTDIYEGPIAFIRSMRLIELSISFDTQHGNNFTRNNRIDLFLTAMRVGAFWYQKSCNELFDSVNTIATFRNFCFFFSNYVLKFVLMMIPNAHLMNN